MLVAKRRSSGIGSIAVVTQRLSQDNAFRRVLCACRPPIAANVNYNFTMRAMYVLVATSSRNIGARPYAVNMKLHIGGATLAACLILLSGCGTPAQQSAVSPSPTPTPTPTASVAQFASIITEHEQDWRDYEENIGACAFASIGTTATDFAKRTACRYTVQTVTLTAKTAARDIRKLPEPPSEIDALVTRTLASLDTIGKNDATAACKDTESVSCDAAETQANGDIRPLVSILDAWKPYTR